MNCFGASTLLNIKRAMATQTGRHRAFLYLVDDSLDLLEQGTSLDVAGYCQAMQDSIDEFVAVETADNVVDAGGVEETHKDDNGKLVECSSTQAPGDEPTEHIQQVKQNDTY